MFTCAKTFDDLPFAHRQWRHPGHCSLIHGHSWAFDVTFAAEALDAMGFVIDFGDLKELRERLRELFDHTLVIGEDDPERERFEGLAAAGLCRIVTVPSGSAEGLAAWVFELADTLVTQRTEGRVRVVEVTCHEGPRNRATCRRP